MTTRSSPLPARLKSLLLLSCFLGGIGLMHAENWPRFRGPSGQGLSTEKRLPLHWSATSNVVWKVAIPGEGWSSPIVWGKRVFVTTVTDQSTRCRVLCLDRDSGELIWDRTVFEIVPLRKESKNSYATPTPVTDGKRVYAVFGDGSMAALDFKGGVVWTNREISFYSRHGLGASPVLHDGLLIMPFDGSNRVLKAGIWPNTSDEERLGWQIPWDKAFIVAVDARTGRRIWTASRGKSRIAHVTPNIHGTGRKAELISPAGDVIQGFDLRTGERLWTAYSQGEGVTPSFAMGEGLVFTASGFEKTTIRTLRLGGRGDVTSTHVAWEQRRGVPSQPSLLYLAPHLHSVTDGGVAHCYQAASGEVIYAERVGGNYSASPVAGAGHIYFLSENGETVVIRQGAEFSVVARNAIQEKTQASMAVSNGRLFIRTAGNLYCIGSKH
ncbi:MAG: hypothetical protein FJ404_10110 [Verrucomicrobia bacterium]|nr:hypothetical protein [Verrucomicrobiota bacterium]